MGGEGLRDPRHSEDISDLSDTDNVKALLLKNVQNSILRRNKREIASVLTSLKIGIRADKGARDNSADTVLAYKYLSCDLTYLVKLAYRNYILVSGDLKYAVGRSLYDQVAGRLVCLPKIADHLRSGIGTIAQNASSCHLPKGLENFLGESVGKGREGVF